jgi:hypothetical protein
MWAVLFGLAVYDIFAVRRPQLCHAHACTHARAHTHVRACIHKKISRFSKKTQVSRICPPLRFRCLNPCEGREKSLEATGATRENVGGGRHPLTNSAVGCRQPLLVTFSDAPLSLPTHTHPVRTARAGKTRAVPARAGARPASRPGPTPPGLAGVEAPGPEHPRREALPPSSLLAPSPTPGPGGWPGPLEGSFRPSLARLGPGVEAPRPPLAGARWRPLRSARVVVFEVRSWSDRLAH